MSAIDFLKFFAQLILALIVLRLAQLYAPEGPVKDALAFVNT